MPTLKTLTHEWFTHIPKHTFIETSTSDTQTMPYTFSLTTLKTLTHEWFTHVPKHTFIETSTSDTHTMPYTFSLNNINFQICVYTWQHTSIQIHGKWNRKQAT